MKRSNYLIYPTVTCWDEPPRARHQVAHELKKDGNVYFVEKNRTGLPRVDVREAEPGIFVLTPYFPVNYKVRYRTPGLNELYHRWLLQKIKAMQIDFDLVLCFDFTAPAIHSYFKNVIFYCADDNVGFGKFNPFFINRYHSRTERLVAERARLCIVTSDYMQGKIHKYNPATHVVPLGAPSVLFNGLKPPRARVGTPVLALVGYLDSNLDYSLLESLLQEFIVHFIGPVSPANRERLERFPHARFLGVKTGDALYEALQEVDVCIAPYDETVINKGATPNKLWLYLAMGKPAVVTNIPNIRSWTFEPGTVYKCANEDFVATCRQAYNEDNAALAQQRVALSQSNSWEERVRTIKKLYFGAAA